MEKLREGFTTGSCAAAAALASCLWQKEGECPRKVEIVVPEGRTFAPSILPRAPYLCGVQKDSGDDPDITNGMEIQASVTPLGDGEDILFSAGEGVGTITQKGLKIPQGEAAINPVPRQMICQAIRSVFPQGSFRVTVSIPGGREKALKTFNPRLGIVNGLSILGTSGIVRPMSEEALRDSMLEELKMRARQGFRELVFSFGNQGEEVMKKLFPRACTVQMSNEVGFMLDSALSLGIEHIILGGHPGKLSKVSAGVMQTHSRYGDTRREAIITQLALMSAPLSLLNAVYQCKTTDAAMEQIHLAGYDRVWDKMAEAAQRYCSLRVRGEMRVSIVFADAKGQVLGACMEPPKEEKHDD